MTTITKPWRIIDIINWGTDRFAEKGIDNARREMEWFLCDVLDCQRIDLYIQFEDLLHENNLIKLRKMVQRRLFGEPFQHILGKGSFYGRDFRVDNNVLIPRPETELLIERLKVRGKVNSLLDIGTGTGCIAITASLEKLAENLFATDSSVSALSVAKENIKIFNVTNVQMTVHNFLHNRFKSKFDVVVSNPPYISMDDMTFLQKEVKDYEPSSALTDNADGLSFYRRFAEKFDNLLISGGVLMLEFGGNGQKDYIEKIFNGAGLKTAFFKDLQKNWRVVEVFR
jgi:release factor glutamine methyltransferase